MVNIVGSQNLVPPLLGDPLNKVNTLSTMTAKAILQCRPNSHPFPERILLLDQPVKIGRSVARARPAKNNAIFDCKVLSRNHALLWYENGKFYLQDTKSSNGTFVNNQRLSKGSEESAPREVCSGDIVQYGVDVMENSRKGTVTHGCIIATLKLYMPDGQEAKASPSTTVGDGSCTVSASDLLHLRTCLQEAQHREQLIETKLTNLQRIISQTQEAATHSWTAMIDEDRLLQRLENLESQLSTYAKNYPEDAAREEIQSVLEEKNRFETTVKESLQKLIQEKMDAVSKCSNVERNMSSVKSELKYTKEVAEATQKELEELMKKQSDQTLELQQLTEKLKEAEEIVSKSRDTVDVDKKELEEKLEKKLNEEKKLIIQIESLKAENDFTKEQLSAIKSKFENIKNGQMSNITAPDNNDNGESEVQKSFQMFRSAVFALQERLWQAQEELHQTQSTVAQLKSEVETAEKVEMKAQEYLTQLQDEMSEKRAKEESNVALIDHLHSQLGILESRLRTAESAEPPKIYDDIYETSTMRRKFKKSLIEKEENDNIVECKDVDSEKSFSDSDIDDSESLSDSTLTIMNSEILDKNSLNGNEKGCLTFDTERIIHLKEDIIKVQEILQLAETSKNSAEEELERIRDEYGQASTTSKNSSYESNKILKQLASNEAVLLEKTRYVSTLQEVGGQLESSLDLIYSHLMSLSQRLSHEKEETLNAKKQVEEFKTKLNEAEQLCKESVEEAEKLRAKIYSFEAKPVGSVTPSGNPDDLKSSHYGGGEDSSTTSSVDPDISIKGSLKIEELSFEERTMIPKLEKEIETLKRAYDKLKEKENNLRLRLNTTSDDSQNESFDSRKEFLTDDAISIEKLKNQLSNLMEEHKRLKESVMLKDSEFSDLNTQNQMTIPTWLLLIMVVSIALGWDYWMSNLF